MMDDPNLILTLKANNERTGRAFSRTHNKNRYVAPPDDRSPEINSRETTPSVRQDDEEGTEFESQLQLTFDILPKDIRRGFVFGSDPNLCDVLLGDPRDGISRRHFNITFDSQKGVVLRDTSRAGTAVSYEGQGATQERGHFTWILFPGIKTEVIIQRRFCFIVELPKHLSCEAEYERRVDHYMRESASTLGPIDLLNLQSQDATAAPTQPGSPKRPEQLPIYYRDWLLGQGEFGTVHRAFDVSTGFVYAAKEFCRGNWKKEVENLRDSLHEHIVQFVCYTDEVKPLLVMEYLPLGSLETQHQANPIAVEEIVSVLYQGLQALEYLHSKQCAHRDIKPANILFQSRTPIHIKFADFGMATDASVLQTVCGTYLYAAPEIWSGARYTVAVDIWSLGVVTFQYAYGLPKHKGRTQHGHRWCKTLVKAVNDWESDDLIDFLSSSMLKLELRARQTASECLTQVEKLCRSPSFLHDNNRESAAPTEVMSSSLIARARRHADGVADPTGDDEAQTCEISPAARGSNHSQVSTQLWNSPGEKSRIPKPVEEQPTTFAVAENATHQRSLKRALGGVSDGEEPLNLLGNGPHVQHTSGVLTETRPGFVDMRFRDTHVSMRKRDSSLDANQIMILGGLDVHRRQQVIDVMRRHTAVEAETANEWNHCGAQWVSFSPGRFLTQALGLQYTLRPLLAYHQRDQTFDEDLVRRENYLLGYLQITTEAGSVMVRKLDFRVNGTHILRAAGRHRQAMVLVRKSGTPFDIVAGSSKYAGTYLGFQDGLELCDRYRLRELKGLLQSARGADCSVQRRVSRTGFDARASPGKDQAPGSELRPARSTQISAQRSVTAHAHRDGASSSRNPEPHSAASLNLDSVDSATEESLFGWAVGPGEQDLAERADADAYADAERLDASLFTEPSFSNGSYLPVLKRTFLEPVCPKLVEQETSDTF